MNHFRPWLDDQGVMQDTKFDMAWLPSSDEDFQEMVASSSAGKFGWPKGRSTRWSCGTSRGRASRSPAGRRHPRYREIYTHMAQGIVQAREQDGVQVLIAEACSRATRWTSSSRRQRRLLKWLDFTASLSGDVRRAVAHPPVPERKRPARRGACGIPKAGSPTRPRTALPWSWPSMRAQGQVAPRIFGGNMFDQQNFDSKQVLGGRGLVAARRSRRRAEVLGERPSRSCSSATACRGLRVSPA